MQSAPAVSGGWAAAGNVFASTLAYGGLIITNNFRCRHGQKLIVSTKAYPNRCVGLFEVAVCWCANNILVQYLE